MPKGPLVPEEIKLAISSLAIERMDRPRGEIADEISNRLEKGEFGNCHRWGYDTVLKHITTARRKERKRQKEENDRLDQAWSLGSPLGSDVPQDADLYSDLLGVQVWCLRRGRQLTVREARWLARLRNAEPSGKPGDCYARAHRYALRERVCLALSLPLDTADLDQKLLPLGPWEREVAVVTGVLPSASRLAESDRAAELEETGRYSYISGEMPASWYADMDLAWSDPEASRLLGDSHLRMTASWPEEKDSVFALWLRYISRGPNWQRMPDVDKIALAERLIQFVNEENEAREGYSPKSERGFGSLGPEVKRPVDILREVGYRDG